MPRLVVAIALLGWLVPADLAHAQNCQEIRDIRRLARAKGQDSAALLRLENRICVGQLYRAVSPNCEELTTMELLVRLEPPKKEGETPITAKQQREISQLRRVICSGNPNYLSPTWSNAKFVVVERDSLYYPNGKRARNRNLEWFYPSGKHAKHNSGKWRYPTGDVAATREGDWSLPNGKTPDNIGDLRKRACKMLGPELCFGGKGVDPDLIVVAMMNLLAK